MEDDPIQSPAPKGAPAQILYCCTAKTMRDLRQLCSNNRANEPMDTTGIDSAAAARQEDQAQKYQNVVLAQLLELQSACSHTAQLFLAKLIPGATSKIPTYFYRLRVTGRAETIGPAGGLEHHNKHRPVQLRTAKNIRGDRSLSGLRYGHESKDPQKYSCSLP
jgi:hypothetical protein